MMKYSSEDPVADVLLDFQSVMEQFLELQADMLGAFAGRTSHHDAPPSRPASAIDCVPDGVPAPSVPAAVLDPPSPLAAVVDLPSAPVLAVTDVDHHSRYTLVVRPRPLGHTRAALAAGHAIV